MTTPAPCSAAASAVWMVPKRSAAAGRPEMPNRSNHTGHDHSAPWPRPAWPLCSNGSVASAFGSRSVRPRGSRSGTQTGNTFSSNSSRWVDDARAVAAGCQVIWTSTSDARGCSSLSTIVSSTSMPAWVAANFGRRRTSQ